MQINTIKLFYIRIHESLNSYVYLGDPGADENWKSLLYIVSYFKRIFDDSENFLTFEARLDPSSFSFFVL